MHEAYTEHAHRAHARSQQQLPEPYDSPRSHARGRGIAHLAQQGSTFEPPPSQPPPFVMPGGPAASPAASSATPSRRAAPAPSTPDAAGTATLPWAGQLSPRVRERGIFDSSGETWRKDGEPMKKRTGGSSDGWLGTLDATMVPSPRAQPDEGAGRAAGGAGRGVAS